ncbi:MAG: DUF5611 family protein [Candidatus Thermoplasmatota archaeon]|nr:DUF5611 family protein [Candidatus Thermoplasmatota archaeon]
MRDYPVKKGVNPTQEFILGKCREIMGKGEIEGNLVITSCSGLSRIQIEIKSPKSIAVETETEKGGDYMKSIKLFNQLLEAVTGYSSKERKKQFSKA